MLRQKTMDVVITVLWNIIKNIVALRMATARGTLQMILQKGTKSKRLTRRSLAPGG